MGERRVDAGDWFVCHLDDTPWFIGRCLRQYRRVRTLGAWWFPPFDEAPSLPDVEAMNLGLGSAVLFQTVGLQGFDTDPPCYVTLGHTDGDPEAWEPPAFLQGPEERSSRTNWKIEINEKLTSGDGGRVTDREAAELPYWSVGTFGYPPARLDYVWKHRGEPGLNLEMSRPWPL